MPQFLSGALYLCQNLTALWITGILLLAKMGFAIILVLAVRAWPSLCTRGCAEQFAQSIGLGEMEDFA